jgi:hypothetical protein
MTLGESRHDVLTQQLELSHHLIVVYEPALPEVEDKYGGICAAPALAPPAAIKQD